MQSQHEDALDTQTRAVLERLLLPRGRHSGDTRPLRTQHQVLEAMISYDSNKTSEGRGRLLVKQIFRAHRVPGLFSTILDVHGTGVYERYYGVAGEGWVFDGRRMVRPRLHLRVPPELSASPVVHVDVAPLEEEVEQKQQPQRLRKVIYDEELGYTDDDADNPFFMDCEPFTLPAPPPPSPEPGPEPQPEAEAVTTTMDHDAGDGGYPQYEIVRFTDVYLHGKVGVARWQDTWHRVSELDGVFTNPSLVFRRAQALKPGYLKRVPRQGNDCNASRAKDVVQVDTRNRRLLVSWHDTEVTREFFDDPKDFDALLDAFWTSQRVVKT